MVFKKIKSLLSDSDEKYEVLYYKYSQIKLENQRLKERHVEELAQYKNEMQKKMALHLIDLFGAVEVVKADSFKVKAIDKDVQRLLVSLNTVERDMKRVMADFSIEEFDAKERFYDPEIHDVASYQDAKGMKKGIIVKTLKRGFKFKNKIIKKPKVVVTK
jgi:molecular chaperone GrpE